MENITNLIYKLIFIALIAFIAANGVSDYIRYSLNSKKKFENLIQSRINSEDIMNNFPIEYFNPIKLFFNKDDEIKFGEGTVSAEPKTLSEYNLQGIIVLSKTDSLAIIKEKASNNTILLMKDELLNGFKLSQILKDKVIFKKDKKEFSLELQNPETNLNKQAPAAKSVKSYTDNYIPHIVSRTDIDKKIFNNSNELLTTLTLVPNMVANKMEGIRLARLRTGSIIYNYGAREGDVIVRVNGHKIDSMEKGYKLWENLKKENYVEIEILRDNKIVTIAFDVVK